VAELPEIQLEEQNLILECFAVSAMGGTGGAGGMSVEGAGVKEMTGDD